MAGHNTTAMIIVARWWWRRWTLMTTGADDDDDVECSPRVNFHATTQNRCRWCLEWKTARAVCDSNTIKPSWWTYFFLSFLFHHIFFLNRRNGFVNIVKDYSPVGFVWGLSLCVRMEFSFRFFFWPLVNTLEFMREMKRKRWREKCGEQDFCAPTPTMNCSWTGHNRERSFVVVRVSESI